jgi:tetratricopeptide (TPR) repeat protein
MNRTDRERALRRLEVAEGYLILELPERALEILHSRSDWGEFSFEVNLLTGEALRAQGHYREALEPLEAAARLRATDLSVSIALGWCYKRTHRLAQAIDALDRAFNEHPDEAILPYNLACYWTLAGNREKALVALATALELDPDYRDQIDGESDFDLIREDPDFQQLVGRHAPQA